MIGIQNPRAMTASRRGHAAGSGTLLGLIPIVAPKPRRNPAERFVSMNTIITSSPGLSVTDVLLVFGFSLLVAGALHLIRAQKVRLGEDIALVLKRYRGTRSHDNHFVEHLLKVRKYHWSLAACVLSWLPFLVLATGNTCCALLGAAGYPVFPWPLLAVGLLFGFTFWVAQDMRLRSIKRLILPTGTETEFIGLAVGDFKLGKGAGHVKGAGG